jgi:hypothetical protein
VVELYLHRGAFEPTLSDEDEELDPDRWCSHSAWGQECWQLIAQWVWNLRLELGHLLEPRPLRLTEFAPALPPQSEQAATHPALSAPASGYSPPTTATSWKAGRFSGPDFVLQPDGTLRCPADQKLIPHEHRRETDGSRRVVYGASIHSSRPCPLREQCQWQGGATPKKRAKSVSSCILSQLGMSHFSGETEVGGFTGVPVSSSCVTDAWRSRRNLFPLPSQLSRLRLFPVQSGHTFGFPGNVDWLAMPVPLRRNG